MKNPNRLLQICLTLLLGAVLFVLIPSGAKAETLPVATGTLGDLKITVTADKALYTTGKDTANLTITFDNTQGTKDAVVEKLMLTNQDGYPIRTVGTLPDIIGAGQTVTVKATVATEGYSDFKDVNFRKEKLKVGIRASYQTVSPSAIFTVEAMTLDSGQGESVEKLFDINLFKDNTRTEKHTIPDGKYAKIYIQIPTGMSTEEVQARIFCPNPLAQFEAGTETIDNVPYFTVLVNSFTAIEPLPAGSATKSLAKQALANYKNPADYREAQQAELRAVLQKGNAAVDAAKTVAELEETVAAAKAEMDLIKTSAQLPPVSSEDSDIVDSDTDVSDSEASDTEISDPESATDSTTDSITDSTTDPTTDGDSDSESTTAPVTDSATDLSSADSTTPTDPDTHAQTSSTLQILPTEEDNGGTWIVFLVAGIGILALAGGVVLMVFRKKIRGTALSLILCLALTLGAAALVSAPATAAENPSVTVPLTLEINDYAETGYRKTETTVELTLEISYATNP
ncbi:MAG: hypothetical protein J6M34_02015 [Clostridia bacterium]|nr:hypothetical protein [Clostridia bacterium]